MEPFMKKKFKVSGSEFRVERRSPKTKDQKPKAETSLIYGLLPVLEALRAAGRRIDKVLIADGTKEHRISEIIDLCRERSIAWNRVPRETFAKHLDAGVNHQGIIAFTASAEYVSTDEILENAADPALIL